MKIRLHCNHLLLQIDICLCLDSAAGRRGSTAKALVGLEKKMVPVQANLRPTCCSNPEEVKTLIQVGLAP